MRAPQWSSLVLAVLAAGCGRTGLDDDTSSIIANTAATPLDASTEPDALDGPDVNDSPDVTESPDVIESRDVTAAADVSTTCRGSCVLTFTSGPDWASFAGGPGADPGDSEGASLGLARDVCASLQTPGNCPSTASGVVVYGFAQGGWTACSLFPGAFWIWRGDVTPGAPADLQRVVLEKTFVLGAQPAGSIQIGADDFAAVFVNDVAVGTVGSVTDVSAASSSQNVGATFDLTGALRAGSNKISIVGQNGPASFSGGCAAAGCTYSQNPAGVVFAGTLTWQ